MNSIQSVFDNDDLRHVIWKHLKNDKIEYTKKVYAKWKKNNNILEIETLPHGQTHTRNTRFVYWTRQINNKRIDDFPLVITDVCIENSKNVYYDTIANFSHLSLKNQPWYIHDFEKVYYDEYTMFDYYRNVIDYNEIYYNKINNILVEELKLRNLISAS